MTIRDFKHELTSLGADFVQLSPFDPDYQHFRFIGPYDGEEIIWDAHAYTLTYYMRKVKNHSSASTNTRAFINVGEINELGRKIEIGLHLPYLDLPSLKKTMIMVRQYKRLSLGQYEFGEIINV